MYKVAINRSNDVQDIESAESWGDLMDMLDDMDYLMKKGSVLSFEVWRED